MALPQHLSWLEKRHFRASRHRFEKSRPYYFSLFTPSDSRRCSKVTELQFMETWREKDFRPLRVQYGVHSTLLACMLGSPLTQMSAGGNIPTVLLWHPESITPKPRCACPPCCPGTATFCHHHQDGPSRAVFTPEAPVLAVVRLQLPFAAISWHLCSHCNGMCL